MGLFTTQAEWKAKCEALESRIESLEADAASSDETITSLRDELAAAKEANATFPSEEEIATLRADLQTAQESASAAAAPEAIQAAAIALLNEGTNDEVNAIVSARVTEELAKAGHQGAVEDNGGKDVTVKTITRAEFDALEHSERNAHIRNGGKVSD